MIVSKDQIHLSSVVGHGKEFPVGHGKEFPVASLISYWILLLHPYLSQKDTDVHVLLLQFLYILKQKICHFNSLCLSSSFCMFIHNSCTTCRRVWTGLQGIY